MAAADLGPDDSEDNVLDLCAAEEDVASLPEVTWRLVCGASQRVLGRKLALRTLWRGETNNACLVEVQKVGTRQGCTLWVLKAEC